MLKNEVSFELVQTLIEEECDAVKSLLLEKNAKYGNSAIQPKRIFSKQNSIEQIKVRIDDKLSRIQNMGTEKTDEDTVKDLIGYLILLKVSERVSNIENQNTKIR
jgi:ATP-dependent helicase/DNAse subunit B